jgi:hypothetical protein
MLFLTITLLKLQVTQRDAECVSEERRKSICSLLGADGEKIFDTYIDFG